MPQLQIHTLVPKGLAPSVRDLPGFRRALGIYDEVQRLANNARREKLRRLLQEASHLQNVVDDAGDERRVIISSVSLFAGDVQLPAVIDFPLDYDGTLYPPVLDFRAGRIIQPDRRILVPV